LSDLIKEIRKSIIYINTDLKAGTGFFIDEQGLAVTCRHVVETADKKGTIHRGNAYVLEPDSIHYKPSKFKVTRTNRAYDLAIIDVDGGPFEKLRLDNNFGDRIASEEIALFGFPFVPFLNYPSLTKGIISAIFTDPRNEVDMIQTDVWIYEASSGSPCFLTENGTVIGYATSSFDPFRERLGLLERKGISIEFKVAETPYKLYTNVCFVVPAKYIQKLL